MKKKDIIKKLDKLGYNREDFWVLTGAAMVLYGIKPETGDIDLGCNKVLADELEKKYTPYISVTGKRGFRINDEVEVYEDWLVDKIEKVEGIQVISIDGLLKMKEELGREKDQKDILLIREFLNK